MPLPGAIGASEASYITFFNYVYKDPSVVALSTFIWRALTFYLPIVLGMVLTLMVNNENSMLSRWLRKDDARMAFTDHTVVPKEKKPRRSKRRKKADTVDELDAGETGVAAGAAIGAGVAATAEVDDAAVGAEVEAVAVDGVAVDDDVVEDVPAAEAVMADEDIRIKGPDGEVVSAQEDELSEAVAPGAPDDTEPEDAQAVVDDAMVAVGGVEISESSREFVADPIA